MFYGESNKRAFEQGLVQQKQKMKQIKAKEELYNSKNYFVHGLYFFLYGLVKYLSIPFANYLRYFVLKMFSESIKTSHICDGVLIWFPWRVSIGKGSSLNQGVIINGFGNVTIGANVRIAAYTCINSVDHNFEDRTMPIKEQGFVFDEVIIEDDVWIGTGFIINKGVKVGKGAVIGSGACVIKDIPPYTVAVGVPAKVIRER
jgi:acetyltransferase-like isoleucine patch superfamily enzyme